MKLRLSLSSKVLILVAIPLLIQIALLAAIASLQSQAEQALKAANHSRKISDLINQISADIFAVYSRYRTYEALESVPFDDARALKLFAQVHNDYVQLKEVSKDDLDIAQTVVNSENATDDNLRMFRELRAALNRAGATSAKERIMIARTIRKGEQRDLVIKRLISIGSEQQRRAEEFPERQAAYREKAQLMLVATGIFDLALGVVVALLLTRGITLRLQRVIDNTYKLASGLPLEPVIRGADEIAHLDRVFHQMANDLRESLRKERAVVENARDFICTVDSNGRLVSANAAALSLLGVKPETLIGKYFIDLVSSENRKEVLNYLEELKSQHSFPELELELIAASSAIVNVICSAQWSEEDGNSFWVVHDMTDRRRAEKLKQEVLAMISHDLRTPLSTIKFVLDFFAKEQESGNEKALRYSLMGQRNVERMFNLVNDLLDIEKIRSGKVTIEQENVQLSRCFKTCEELSSGFAQDFEISLCFEHTDLMVFIDEKRIDRVLSNLVANAIKFSPKNTTVRISTKVEENNVCISVEDEGPGVPLDQIETVFERFHQIRGNAAASKGGSGLGLTICKAIVELHGGRIWAEHAQSGGKFSFTLPLALEA
ncbi:hypothetical protein BH10CYA1_BH10CYA1_36240 [soil metagenome]